MILSLSSSYSYITNHLSISTPVTSNHLSHAGEVWMSAAAEEIQHEGKKLSIKYIFSIPMATKWQVWKSDFHGNLGEKWEWDSIVSQPAIKHPNQVPQAPYPKCHPFIIRHQWNFVCLWWHPYKHDCMMNKKLFGNNLGGGAALSVEIWVRFGRK